ncbi:hypothetical protein A1O3_08563 [Capronia epimyces CBS 606.96]|uniref:Zn(2)-C6 fungal-type domain-containing protein n=1 Tax=Capronia epimyces CBS 606.96 TaxID=1182542 RepID=W9XEX9_9EURO|nr:uncharacterized protein A1O3_08563 [Capronia epimyces CBS 606.96]EXJ79062.1 hypothetical protein A1O3_08563 [Capronia epimyces CBS 606.96]
MGSIDLQCDETHPQCKRCTKTGKTCPGYRPPTQSTFRPWFTGAKPPSSGPKQQPLLRPLLSIGTPEEQKEKEKEQNHNHTGYPISTDDRSTEALPFPAYDGSHSDAQAQARSLVRQSRTLKSSPDYQFQFPRLIPPAPSTQWESLVLPLFFNLFSSSPGFTKYDGLMSFLPRAYTQSSPGSCLHAAVAAAADANAFRKLTGSRALLQARHKHLIALSAVQRAIQDPVEAVQDSTLCSLYVLTLYEVINLINSPSRAL